MKKILSLCMIAILTVSFTGCGNTKPQPKSEVNVEENSQKIEEKKKEEKENKDQEGKQVSGVVNRKDGNLVLLSGDFYYNFTLGAGVSLDKFEEGDEVTVSYTGNLEEMSADLVALAIVKN